MKGGERKGEAKKEEKPGRKETQVRKQRRGRKGGGGGGPVQKKIRGKVWFQKVQVRGGRRS